METETQPTLKTADKKVHMREYMRKRYNENKEECRANKNSVKYKNTYNLPAEELKEYGMYLADIHRLRKIKEKLPIDLFEKVIQENNILATS